MADRILVLTVDIDNDLYRKAKITGPVIGRSENLKSAAALAYADPQDPDSNAMFEAVKKYDELKKKGYSVGIATITGAEKEGFVADREISRQIDIVLDRFKADSCVLVTDGASDQRVLPILKTRIKVDSVDIVRMKQAAGFEQTYFTILEKLKEPHYARIVFGIPAALFIIFAISYYFNFGWELPLAIIGVYLVIYGFGFWEALVDSFRRFGFSIDRLSFIFYISAVLFLIISIILGYGSYIAEMKSSGILLSGISAGIQGFLLIFPISMALYLIGRVMDLERKRLRYMAIKQGTYVGYSIISVAIVYLVTAWFIGQIYFWQLLVFSLISILGGYGISELSNFLKRSVIRKARMKSKKVITDIGAYVGKIDAVDSKHGYLFIKTEYGNVIKYEIDRIINVSDRVIVR